MTEPLFIIGAGGFGREVFSMVEAIARAGGARYDVAFADDDPATADLERVASLGSYVACTVDALSERTDSFAAVIAIGSPVIRRAIAERLATARVTFPSLVHPYATVGRNVVLGAGTVVAAGARLSTNIELGRHVHVDQNVTIGHDSNVNDFARLNPQACISGAVQVGSGALVGAAAVVLPGTSIGDFSTVGAGAVVTRDVPEGVIVKGVPAK